MEANCSQGWVRVLGCCCARKRRQIGVTRECSRGAECDTWHAGVDPPLAPQCIFDGARSDERRRRIEHGDFAIAPSSLRAQHEIVSVGPIVKSHPPEGVSERPIRALPGEGKSR